MFALDEELAQWEAQLAHLQGAARLDLLAQLAWHRRQRDPARRAALAREAAPLLARWPTAQRRRLEARFMLVGGEAQWLAGALDAARALAEQALQLFEHCADPPAAPTRHWLLAWIERPRRPGRRRRGAGQGRRRRARRRRPGAGRRDRRRRRAVRRVRRRAERRARWGGASPPSREAHPAAAAGSATTTAPAPSRPATTAAPSAT